jgi:hypothetical protein
MTVTYGELRTGTVDHFNGQVTLVTGAGNGNYSD